MNKLAIAVAVSAALFSTATLASNGNGNAYGHNKGGVVNIYNTVNITQNTHVTNINNMLDNSKYDQSIDKINVKNNSQDKKINTNASKNTEQDTRLDGVEEVNGEQSYQIQRNSDVNNAQTTAIKGNAQNIHNVHNWTVDQFQKTNTQVYNNTRAIEGLKNDVKDLKAGVAGAYAAASHQFDVSSNAGGQMSVAGGHYGGSNAVSMAFGAPVNEKVFINVNATHDSEGNTGYGAGANFKLW